MKIIQIECLILDKSFPFIIVHTDEGLTGIGECFRRQPMITKSVIDNILGPALLGKNPIHIEDRYNDMIIAGSALEI